MSHQKMLVQRQNTNTWEKIVLPVKQNSEKAIYTVKLFHRCGIQKANPYFSEKSMQEFLNIFVSRVSQSQLRSYKIYTIVQGHLFYSEKKLWLTMSLCK